MVSMLAKIPNARLVKDFRPIAVLPVIYKLYSRVMYMLAENTCDRLYAPQFAFRKFHQAHEVVFIMRQLIEKAVEWKAPEIYIMDGDIKKAYDYASHTLFAEAARSRGMHEVLTHAWLREWRSMRSVFKLDSQTTSKEVDRTRSFPQGDPAAPMIFNLVLDTIAETFIKTAIQKGWGKKLQDGSWVNLIMFADNYWLVATSAQMLTLMTREWLSLLERVGWETPVEELSWCTTADDDINLKIIVNDKLVRRPKRGEGFKVLGTMVTFDNNFDVEIENRLARTSATFSANGDLLGCASASFS